MKIFWHDVKSEINFLLGLYGYTVQVAPVVGEPFDAVVEGANSIETGGAELVYYPFDEEKGEADRSYDPESINTAEIAEMAVY